MKKKLATLLIAFSIIFGGVAITTAPPVLAQSAGTVDPSVQKGVDDAIATTKALSPLVLAAMAAGLGPLAGMLALKFLHMMLSRA